MADAWVWVFPKLVSSLFAEELEQDSDRRGRCHVATEATGGTTRGDGGANLHTGSKITWNEGTVNPGSDFELPGGMTDFMKRAAGGRSAI